MNLFFKKPRKLKVFFPLGHLGGYNGLPGYYGHPHVLPATEAKPMTEVAPTVVADPKIVRVLNAPYGFPYRYGPTPLPILNRGVAGVNPVVAPVATRVLNAPYGAPYRYGPTVSGVGPKADAFGRRYWW